MFFSGHNLLGEVKVFGWRISEKNWTIENIFIISSDCRVTKENNNFLVLSDKQTDASTAIRTCSSLEGKLAEVTSQTSSQEIKNFLRDNLISKGEKCFSFTFVMYYRSCKSMTS